MRHVLFDADGVCVHGFRFSRWLAETHGVTREEQREFFGGPFRECTVGRAALREVLAPFVARWPWPGDVDSFIAEWFSRDATLDPPVLATARDLRGRGFGVHLASNQEAERALYLENTLGFADVFERRFFSCRLGHAKPDPGFFRAVEAELGVDGGDTLLFFDDAQSNVDAARSVGWRAERYADFGDFAATLSHHIGGEG